MLAAKKMDPGFHRGDARKFGVTGKSSGWRGNTSTVHLPVIASAYLIPSLPAASSWACRTSSWACRRMAVSIFLPPRGSTSSPWGVEGGSAAPIALDCRAGSASAQW